MNLQIDRSFRADVNGLRGLAVLLVLLFHLDIPGLEGGYLGVDVFLVISGYFISRNILFDLQNNQFTFGRFYTKRARRLFPAIFFTLFITLICGLFILSAVGIEQLGKSVIFSILPVSNFYFLSESGYFDMNAIYKPLLHMWSLSLEEQFYFIWPLFLVVLFRHRPQWILLIIAITTVASLTLAEIYVRKTPDVVFFMLPFRMFEFIAGALTIWLEKYHLKNKLREGVLLVGLAMILYSSTTFDHLSPIPGILAMIPVLGTVMVIYAGKSRSAQWILGNRFMGLLGKSSFSIYLLHWPAVVFYQYITMAELTLFDQLVIGLFSVAGGYFMWKFVETPFRKLNEGFDKIWIAMPALTVALIISSMVVWSKSGLIKNPPEYYMTLDEILDTRKIYWDKETLEPYLDVGSDKTVLVMGNSHAIDLIYALRNNGLDANIISLRTYYKCFNFGTPLEPEYAEFCQDLLERNLNSSAWGKVDAIYLHDHWPAEDLEDLESRIKQIRSQTTAPIFVFGPKLIFSKTVTEIVHASEADDPVAINRYAQQFAKTQQRRSLNERLITLFEDEYFERNDIHYVDVLTTQCGPEVDHIEVVSKESKDFIYFDESHLTEWGATAFGAKLKQHYPNLFTVQKN